MPKGKTNEDTSMLSMALLGYESEKKRIEEKIQELRSRIGGGSGKRPGRPPKHAASAGADAEISGAPEDGRKRRTLSAAARKRIAAAQKKRWAEHRKRAAVVKE